MRTHRKPQFTLPLAVVAGFAVPVSRAWDAGKTGGYKEGVGEISRDIIGIKPWIGGWTSEYLHFGLYPILIGFGVHKLAGALGVNRMIAQAGIPVIRI